MADGGSSGPAALDHRGSSQQSVELDILQLSQRWESQRTIGNGDTPGQALRKGRRPALASISTNIAAEPINPFSFTAQRQKKSMADAALERRRAQQQQQPSVRFLLDEPQDVRRQEGAAEAAPVLAGEEENLLPAACDDAAGAATPCTLLPASLSRAAVATGGKGAGSSSPSPYVLFRGRLSFAAGEADSARKYDRPTTARKPGPATGAGLKRKLLVSPGADISAAFPTLLKPSAKQRRRSLSDAGPSWASRSARAEPGEAAAAAQSALDALEPKGSGEGVYWSDPLPLPGQLGGSAAAAAAHARALPFAAAAGAADDNMQDTAASPASSCGGAPCSPVAGVMDTCCAGSPAPAFSPLRECSQPCRGCWAPRCSAAGAMQHSLPTVENPDCGFPAITVQTMRDLLLHGAAAFGLSDYVIVDCRYDYEYQGGRLPGAVHLTTPEELASFLATPRPCPDYWQRTALIFHCEFSTERGPRAAKHVRNRDREAHMADYPALSQPHVFVLQGGYKAFWKAHGELCEGGYTPMDHPDFAPQLKACHNVVRRAWAKTTRTYDRTQRQRRPTYRLRQSSGMGRAGEQECGKDAMAPPAVAAAQHEQRAC
ncbi:hypothetical protein ABPG77_000589 [Micractinium sp. CCAP 211/92]